MVPPLEVALPLVPNALRASLSAILAAALAGCGAAPGPLAAARQGDTAAAASAAGDLKAARSMAIATLRANTHEVTVPRPQAKVHPRRQVLYAGGGHFGALWTRDGMYGALGLLAAGEHAVVRDCLATILEAQRPDGQLPRRVGAGSNALGIVRAALGLAPKQDDNFDYADFAKPSVDANALVIWLSAEYVAATDDADFVAARFAALDRAAGWLQAKVQGGLLTQGTYADWKDMNARGGQVMYSNALYYKSLKSMAQLAAKAGDAERQAAYELRARELAARIREAFWDAGRGHFKDTTTLLDFSPEGDLFAVLFGIATPAQAQASLRKAEALLELRPLLPALDGDYPASMIPVQVKLAGLEDYHDRFMWPWLTDLHAWTLASVGQKGKATRALARAGKLALRDGTFHEIYEGAEPVAVKRKFYHSEPAFSWHAGLFVRAAREIGME